MAIVTLAAPNYRRELDNGLIQRWSTSEDTENIAQLCGLVFRDNEDEPLNPRMIDNVRQQMSGNYPLMGPGDYALIEDTRKEGNPLVACTCLWRQQWQYEDIAFGVGQPEFVATHPDYRNRGLIRVLFAMLHARSEAEGHLVQGITGIPYFYRQFGYEYALELEGRRVTYLSHIPKAQVSTPEPYSLRVATTEDIPLLLELYNRQRSVSMVWAITSERYWRYQIEEVQDATVAGKQMTVRMIVDDAGTVQGYLMVGLKRWGSSLNVYALNLALGVSWQAVMPSLLRALQSYGMQIPVIHPAAPPLNAINFWLGSAHPVYDVLGNLAPFYEPPYAWYIRVPDMLAFIRHIAPALERRIANSTAAAYTCELTLDFYRGGLRIVFDKGRITQVEPWRPAAYKNEADASCPPLVFIQLLFGYRSLPELRYAFPDVRVENSKAEVLLNTLFPKKFSWIPG